MIVVHHLNNSRSQRVLWLLEELGLDYEVKRYERDANMMAPEALKKIHPLGRSPVIVDGDIVVAETGAIMEYILDQYGNGRLRPSGGTADRRRFTYWMHYAEGSAMPPLLVSLIFSAVKKAPVPFFIRPIVKGIAAKVNASFTEPELKLHFGFVESELAKSTWLAGPEFSAADIQMSFPMEAAQARGAIDSTKPKSLEFLKRIHERPAYLKALQKGGPYDLLS